MSRTLSDLLGAKEPMFSLALRQLEKTSGQASVDVRLSAEIVGKVKLKTRELGLDPGDTTGTELFLALKEKARKHDLHLAQSIGGTDPEDVADLLPRMKIAVEKIKIPKSCWVLKKSVAKRMLHNMPPPNIMKHLRYKSIDSMLKNESLAEIYGALRFAEGQIWLNEFNETYKKIKPSDFETREIEIVQMSLERWGAIAESFVRKKRHNITHLKELGVILMLPITLKKLQGITILAMPLLLHYINEIRLYSSFFKLQQVKPNFGEIIVDTLIANPSSTSIMSGQNIHWRVIQRYFGKLENEYHPEIFEPHVQPEDLHWRKVESILCEIVPELKFWQDMDYVGVMHDGRPVSFNLMDNAVNFCDSSPYAKRTIYHFREALWNEIFMRYMGEKVLEDQILKQLDNDLIITEELKL